MILSAIELTLVDDEAEQRFLQAFVAALPSTENIKGLVKLTAWKQVGADRTYMAFTVWDDEASIDAWMKGEQEQNNIAITKAHLCVESKSSRWNFVKDHGWTKES